MIEKSEKSDSDSSSGGSHRRGGMKVNVMYRGTMYRVRGVKVLVSVVTAVILLLVAIVGLGVWMLVSAYAEEKATTSSGAANTTLSSLGQQETSTPYTIDFNAPSATLDEASFPTRVANSHSSDGTISTEQPTNELPSARETLPADASDVSEAVGHFQGVTPRKNVTSTSSRSPGPDPVLGIFNGVPDLQEEGMSSAEAQAPPVKDSFIEYSENRPVIALPPPPDGFVDSGGLPVAYEVNTNPWVEEREPNASPRYPLQGGLPDNIPRDIDPLLLDMGLPFPYPPSLPTRAPLPSTTSSLPRRPNRPSYRVPAATRRGQQISEPHEEYHSHEEHKSHVANHSPYTAEPRSPDEPSIPSRTPPDTFTRPGGLIYPDFEKFIPSEGSHMPAGLTLPPGMTLPPKVSLPVDVASAGGLADVREAAEEHLRHRPFGPGSYLEDMMYYYNKHERRRPSSRAPPTPTRADTRYSQRAGLTAEGAAQEYSGPPVVGYGDLPYRRLHGGHYPSDPSFQYFWDVYGYDGPPPAKHDDRGPVPEEASHAPGRGAQPPGSRPAMHEYWPQAHDHPQQTHAHETRFGPSPPAAPAPRHPPPMLRGGQPHPVRPDAERPPIMHPAQHHAQYSPDRRLWVDPNPHPLEAAESSYSSAPSSRPGPSPPPNHRPFLGPLYDMYEYSKKLANTLLSLSSVSPGSYNSSRQEYMMNEMELLEDYNRVFQNPNTTSADVLPDMFDDRPSRNERLMLIDSSKLRSLSPFELSLITWTFLDFWEFLIEQVGTLSQDDLNLLEQKLERLRIKKDRVMTKNLMTATVNHQVEQESGRSLQDAAKITALAEKLLQSLQEEEDEEEKEDGAVEGRETGRMWDPLGVFESNQKVKFMEFAIKVLFKFGRVYLQKDYALDCMMLLFCKDLNANSKKTGMDGTSAKIKSVGLKVLTEKDARQMDTMGEIWRALTAWETLQCETMFPRCDGPRALEIVNDVALGSRRK